MLETRDLSIRFDSDRTRIVYDNLRVCSGEVLALLGPSGSGKSTLLRIIAGILGPATGDVFLNGRPITHRPPHTRSIGLVFQDEQLFPHLDVAANVGYGLKMQGVSRRDRSRRVEELLGMVGLAGFGRRRIDRLSGGEAKRVALARALAPRPDVLLFDEPLTGLDRDLHTRLLVEVVDLLAATGTTAVWVTHDEDEAAHVARRVQRMSAPPETGRGTQ